MSIFLIARVGASSGSSSFQLDPGIVLVCIIGIALLGMFFWFRQRHEKRRVGLRCPSCGDHRVRRSRTRNWGEALLKLALFHPYRCRDCERRFWAFLKE
jgi:DNA-directed RNA polymerase subunit RPC12/RpoP